MAPARSPSSAATMRTSARSGRRHDLVGERPAHRVQQQVPDLDEAPADHHQRAVEER